jgi:drug/metabolite transporter (DMT)-like permease
MSRRGVALFAAMSVIWGIPYLLIKVAVEELSPPTLVAARTTLAAVVLLPLAIRRGALRPALARWRPLALFILLEMAVPWVALAHAEKTLPSGLTGLLIACVPLGGTVIAFGLGDRRALRPIRIAGLAAGLCGVGLLVGLDLHGDRWRVAEVMVVVVGYATGPFIVDRKLSGVPSIGLVAASLSIVSVVFLPIAVWQRPAAIPSLTVLAAVVVLAGVCTGGAFVLFFALIAEIGPQRASLITFANPVVAVTAGVAVGGESFGVITAIGFVFVLAGCWLSTRRDEPGAAGAEPHEAGLLST